MSDPIDRGPEPASPTPWSDDRHQFFADLRQDKLAIRNRVNNWNALCDRAEAAEHERDKFMAALDESSGTIMAALAQRDAALVRAEAATRERNEARAERDRLGAWRQDLSATLMQTLNELDDARAELAKLRECKMCGKEADDPFCDPCNADRHGL